MRRSVTALTAGSRDSMSHSGSSVKTQTDGHTHARTSQIAAVDEAVCQSAFSFFSSFHRVFFFSYCCFCLRCIRDVSGEKKKKQIAHSYGQAFFFFLVDELSWCAYPCLKMHRLLVSCVCVCIYNEHGNSLNTPCSAALVVRFTVFFLLFYTPQKQSFVCVFCPATAMSSFCFPFSLFSLS